MTKIQVGRLLTLAWFLKTEVRRGDFDMCKFVHECGSPSCAAGRASTDKDSRVMRNASDREDYR